MTPTTPTSPKAVWAGLGTLLASIVLAILTAPGLADYLAGIPAWVQFLVLAAIPPVVAFLSAYAKRDPLRDAGQVHLDTQAGAAPGPGYSTGGDQA